MRRIASWIVVACLPLAGCSHLLPAASTDAHIGFDGYEIAEQALAKVVPYRTTLAELEGLGFQPSQSANVLRIGYPDLIARLAPNAAVSMDSMDPGIRECILARRDCQLYEFNFGRQDQRRVGSFLLDFLNFRRKTIISGWTFKALVVVKDGRVLFTSHSGEPRIDHVDDRVNPLGPLQGSGEVATTNVLSR